MKQFITKLAKSGGKIAFDNLFKKKKISYKKQKEIVTSIDRKIEKMIVKEIKKKYPKHNIIGEEFNYPKTDSKYSWVIDPIDGTINYARGFPHFCTSIAVLFDNEPVITAMYDPCKEHMFFSQLGKGAYLNNKKIAVSNTTKIDNAIVEISESDKSSHELRIIKNLLKKTNRIRCLGSTALSLCYVASGWIDCRIKTTIGRYDVAGGVLLIREAGGSVTDFKGNYWEFSNHTSLIAANKKLKSKFLSLSK